MTEDNSNLKEGKDFTYDEQGRMVFTADYLFNRGYCCESGCKNCPYGYGQPADPKRKKPSFET